MLELKLSELGGVPVDHRVLLGLLSDYKRPNDKIAEWLRQGVLLSIKRGLYVVATPWRQGDLSLPLIANHLYGPSCVSLEYAMAWHGIIPERVHEVTSVCMRRARTFDNACGRFSYVSVPQAVYPFGIAQHTTAGGVNFLMASSEKALCDKIMTTRNLNAFGRNTMASFLFDDLRVDEPTLADFDVSIVQRYAHSGHKPRQFQALCKVLEDLA